MNHPDDKPNPAGEPASDPGQTLRRQAEEILRTRQESAPEAIGIEQSIRLVHELRVHQIELEMQNEELRRAHAELEDSQARFVDLYDFAPVGYVTVSEAGMILQANLTAATFLGAIRGALIRQPLTRFILPEDQDIYYRHRKQLFETGEPQACELRMLRPDNPPFWARMETTVAQDADGGPVSRIAMSDITERKRMQEEQRHFTEMLETRVEDRTRELQTVNAFLQKTTAQLRNLAEELMKTEERERKRLAAILHDDLQQILVATKMRTSLLQRRISDADHAQSLLEVMELIGDAIGVSRSLVADLSPPILRDGGLMLGLIWLSRWIKENHGLTVEITWSKVCDIPDTLSILTFQAVRELLLNVVKHAGVDRASIDIDQPESSSLRVVVSDQGSGFSPNASESFGLLNLRERLTYFGGAFDVTSAAGHGTRVSFTVPFKPTSLPPGASVVSEKACEQLPSGDVRPERRQLLVVDDHPVVRQGLVELLSKEADIAVIGTAADGEQAIQAARKLHPDIVLMDISMPGINGIQASRIITTEMPDVHVICLSMHEPMEMKYKMREAGAAFYFRKDGPMEDLIATIRSFPLRCKKGLSTTV